MGRKGVFGNKGALLGRVFLTAFLTMFLSGCGASLLNNKESSVDSYLWKHRDQYVRIEAQDQGKSVTPANEHPAQIPAAELRDMLGSLAVHFEKEEKPETLFTFKELEILAPALSEGLAKAGPRQDVTFAIVGIHRGVVSFSHDRSVITGRVFVKDNRLNLILGKMHEEYVADEDRRTHPLLPGSRKESFPLPQWGKPWKVVPLEGLETKTVAGADRHDWLVLNPDREIWKAAIAEKKETKAAASAALKEATQVRETSTQLKAEQQQLRSEIREMKQTIREMQQAPAAQAPAVAPATVPAPAAPSLGGVEHRLEVLKKLMDKGLITEKDYQSKKQEILDSL